MVTSLSCAVPRLRKLGKTTRFSRTHSSRMYYPILNYDHDRKTVDIGNLRWCSRPVLKTLSCCCAYLPNELRPASNRLSAPDTNYSYITWREINKHFFWNCSKTLFCCFKRWRLPCTLLPKDPISSPGHSKVTNTALMMTYYFRHTMHITLTAASRS